MQLVTPYATLVDVPDTTAGIALLRKIERCARISHRSEEKQGPDTWTRFLTSVVLHHGDWSVVEHASVTVEAEVDRGIQQEWTRHRLFAYTVESTRFVNYEKRGDLRFVAPSDVACDPESMAHWVETLRGAEEMYTAMLRSGYTTQIARSVLPLSLASKMVISGNLRNWRHFLNLRVTRETHPQMREVTIPLLQQFKDRLPLLFDDIVENDSQINAMKRPR